MRWYYAPYTVDREIYSEKDGEHANGLVAPFVEYNGVLYGGYSNPIFKVLTREGLFDTYHNYYINDDIAITTADNKIVRYNTVIGVLDDYSVDNGLFQYKTDENSTNIKISGRWRAKKVWNSSGLITLYGYLIPLLATYHFKNGDVFAGNMFGIAHNTSGIGCLLTIANTDSSKNIGSTVSNYTTTNTEFEDMIIDFGSIPQNVPKFIKDRIERFFDYIYPNTYIIKSPTGEILAQENEQPAIKKTNLIWAGNSYQLSFTREDDIVETMTWSYETPEGKTFIGLGTSPNGGVVIPVGEKDISITDSFTLYPVFAPYKVNPETFDIHLFKNEAEYNRVDKTNYLEDFGTVKGTFRESTSITELTVTIESNIFPTFNYAYIPILNRFYFVNDIKIVNNKLYEIDMSIDVLMTYKNEIKELRAFVDRNENTQNPLLIDKKRVVEQGVIQEKYAVNNDVISENFDENSIRFVLNGYKLFIRASD